MPAPPELQEGESQGVNLLIHVVFVARMVDNWASAKGKNQFPKELWFKVELFG